MNTHHMIPILGLAFSGCILLPSDAGDTYGSSDASGSSDSSTSSGGPPDPSGGVTTVESGGSGASGPGATSYGGESSGGSSGGSSGDSGQAGCEPGVLAPGCPNELDVLIVVDNSATMAEEQLRLARAMPQFVEQLSSMTTPLGEPLDPDVHVMVTTTDFGHPRCGFDVESYVAAQGAPTTTPCTDRLSDFERPLAGLSVPETCTDVCPTGVAPTDHYLAFSPSGSNVPDTPDVDIDGDGVPDSDVARALACLVPQGITGCDFESPLETMLQGAADTRSWNQGPNPFLRDDAALAIMIMTDEFDCSVRVMGGYDIFFQDTTHQNIDPDLGAPQPTSAVCWNAGVECTGMSPDYGECTSTGDDLHDVERYTQYLYDYYAEQNGKQVVMLELVGVPEVTARMPDAPFLPIAGGVDALAYRDWIDAPYPMGDLSPQDIAEGRTAAHKMFESGIGPGCIGQDAGGQITTQATPPVRMLEVCNGLGEGNCCVESICDDDYGPALHCLSGMLTAPAAE